MIQIDNRTGSKELFPLFPRGSARLTRLEYADLSFMGIGEDSAVAVGVERKRIGDFINSMATGRLSGHQLRGLLNSYHYVYLVIEGIFRANPSNGMLEVWRRGGWTEYLAGRRQFMAKDIWAYMNTLEIVCGVHCYHCAQPTDTVHYVLALHQWWAKEYEEHRSHLAPNTGRDVQLLKATVVRRMAAQLDGVGWERAKAIDQVFGSMEALVRASEGELREVEGIGKKLAASIVNQLHGGGA
ncbi:MAG: helix-hairpin-helix domain-containing protein [Dehalococcoidales bacterium]|nr:helix-hairpin-helix domain-containing protein [Dehalococcoidales bacterium]